jgi:hypothetical protein
MTPPNPGGDQTRSGATPCRRTAGRHPRRCWRPLSLDAGCIPSPGRRVPAISSPLDQNYQQGHSRCGVGRLSAWAGEPGHRLVAGLPASKDQQPDTIPVAAPTMPIPMAAGSPSRLAPGAGAGRARTIGKVLGSRPGREILPRLRPGIPLRGWRGAGGAGASAEGERVRRTMGPRRPRRVPGLAPDCRTRASGAGPENLCQAVQRAPSATGAGARGAGSTCRAGRRRRGRDRLGAPT